MTTNLTITKTGQDAIALALLNSDEAITITTVAVGAGDIIIPFLSSVTALQKEIARTAFVGDSDSMPAAVAGYGVFEGGEAWAAWEIGIFARSGDGDEFLFAYAQAANNASGIKMALLVKDADEPARYDFSLVFAPAAIALPNPNPKPKPNPMACAAPQATDDEYGTVIFASTAEVNSRSAVDKVVRPSDLPPSGNASAATRFATNEEAEGYAAVDAALKPNQQNRWSTFPYQSYRGPTAADAEELPLGHIWKARNREWTLAFINNSFKVWKQTKGMVRLYEHTGAAPASGSRTVITIPGSYLLRHFSVLFFHGSKPNRPDAGIDTSSPISIAADAFVYDREKVYMVNSNVHTLIFSYVSLSEIEIYSEYGASYYCSKIYGLY